jgi:hypothetical protein
MLETMRAYGREHLQHQGLSDTTRARHARYMADTISALSLRTLGPDEQEATRRLDEYLPDALVSLDWFIDHHEWEQGLRVTPAGPLFERRQQGEMVARLYDAAKIGGASRDLLDELERSDQRVQVTESIQDSAERGWRIIRAAAPIPTDRAAFSPHGDFFRGGLAAADVGEFLASLERWDSAAPLNRYLAEWGAIRAVAQNGYLDLLEQPLNRFTAFVTELHSGRAMRGLAELHGFVARKRHDWVGAAHWYGQAASAGDGELASWFDLAVAWHLLTARALSAETFELKGDELRDPWSCYRNEHLDMLGLHGATSTAVALHRVGRSDLAERFIAWAYRHDPTSFMAVGFADVLESAGLAAPQVDHSDDLDVLIEELLAIADELDGLL